MNQFFARSANQNIVDEARGAWLAHFPIEQVLHRRGTPKKVGSPDTDFVFSNNLESLTKFSPVQPFQQQTNKFTSGFFWKVQSSKKTNQ